MTQLTSNFKEYRNWSRRGLDKKTGLNIIDKPVSKNGFALLGQVDYKRESVTPVTKESTKTGEPMLK